MALIASDLMILFSLYSVCTAEKERLKISVYGGLKLQGEVLVCELTLSCSTTFIFVQIHTVDTFLIFLVEVFPQEGAHWNGFHLPLPISFCGCPRGPSLSIWKDGPGRRLQG